MITQERVKHLFEYRDGKIFWKNSTSKFANKLIGKRAGSQHAYFPYRSVWFDGKHHKEHRVIFLMHHGYLPKYIDHISDDLTEEGIKSNKIENLREIDRGANLQKSNNKRGSSKYKGVSYIRGKWQAGIRRDGKRKYLGIFETEYEASIAYDIAAKEIFGEHAYTNH